MKTYWQKAFILHSRPWREISLMLDVFTEESGRVYLASKGNRSKNKNSILKGTLQPFTPLLIYFDGQDKVKTLYSAEAISPTLPLSGIALYSGLYINELISRVLEYEINCSELFFNYLYCIQTLAGISGSPEPTLRWFELVLLYNLGYNVDFLHCSNNGVAIEDTMTYRYSEENGFIISTIIDCNTFTGRHLRALAERKFPDVDTLRAAKRFTRIALKPYIGVKPLKSRELFWKFISPQDINNKKYENYYD